MWHQRRRRQAALSPAGQTRPPGPSLRTTATTLRLLAFSDLHRDRKQARRLVEISNQVDVVIGAGDFASMRVGLGPTIEALSAITKPTLLVAGNNESHGALASACAGFTQAIVLHGESVTIDDVTFFGLGSGVPLTPLPWSFDLDEERAAAELERCPAGAVLIVHSPPKGCADKVFGRHLGSTAIREAIIDKQPPLAICGHIHQGWGQECKLGETRVLNVGPHGKLVEL